MNTTKKISQQLLTTTAGAGATYHSSKMLPILIIKIVPYTFQNHNSYLISFTLRTTKSNSDRYTATPLKFFPSEFVEVAGSLCMSLSPSLL